MLDALRSFLTDLTGAADRPAGGFTPDDVRVAAIALLVHLANADGVVSAAERNRLGRLVRERLGLDEEQARALIAQASTEERQAVDLYHFTSVLKRRLDEAGRRAVVEAMWRIAYADGLLSELEENVIWRVAELLAVPPRERIALRQQVEREGTERPAGSGDAGPWGPATARNAR